MVKSQYHVIGVMSGTSLDGVDIAYCTFVKTEDWSYKIHRSKTYPYDDKWASSLKSAIDLNEATLLKLDHTYSRYLGELIKKFITEEKLSHIDFVSSHGHTVYHQPHLGFTYQIGNKQDIADTCGFEVICDYRVQDVERGGQGAPLVPIGDKKLFQDFDFCLNLGGFANVSYDNKDERIAFDICPVNIVLNNFSSQIGLSFDNKGIIASKGQINNTLLKALNNLGFYHKNPPKSLGLEWVRSDVLPLIEEFRLSVEDILRTFVEHIAIQITHVMNKSGTRCLITGGGAYNDFLINRLKTLSSTDFIIPNQSIIEYKEALIFAFLGVLKHRNEVNCLKSVTNAEDDHCSGKVLIPTF